MNRCFVVYCILFIPIICSSNVTSNIETGQNKTIIRNDFTKESSIKKTQPLVVAEGGPLVLSNRTSILWNDSHSLDLETVDKELKITKLKPIHPRKGVGNPSDEIISNENVSTVPSEMNNIKTLPVQLQKEQNMFKTNMSVAHKFSDDSINNLTVSTASEHVSFDKVHKKPLILSSEILDRNTKITKNKEIIPLVTSSSNTLVSDQIPLPYRDVKSYKMATKHPGLVTPVVITILVVPVFALLGYMAFTRGREAWKNRHYKRMDFLLDGMYNE